MQGCACHSVVPGWNLLFFSLSFCEFCCPLLYLRLLLPRVVSLAPPRRRLRKPDRSALAITAEWASVKVSREWGGEGLRGSTALARARRCRGERMRQKEGAELQWPTLGEREETHALLSFCILRLPNWFFFFFAIILHTFIKHLSPDSVISLSALLSTLFFLPYLTHGYLTVSLSFCCLLLFCYFFVSLRRLWSFSFPWVQTCPYWRGCGAKISECTTLASGSKSGAVLRLKPLVRQSGVRSGCPRWPAVGVCRWPWSSRLLSGSSGQPGERAGAATWALREARLALGRKQRRKMQRRWCLSARTGALLWKVTCLTWPGQHPHDCLMKVCHWVGSAFAWDALSGASDLTLGAHLHPRTLSPCDRLSLTSIPPAVSWGERWCGSVSRWTEAAAAAGQRQTGGVRDLGCEAEQAVPNKALLPSAELMKPMSGYRPGPRRPASDNGCSSSSSFYDTQTQSRCAFECTS